MVSRNGEERKFAVVGLGRFGTAVATTLFDLGVEVLAIDNDPKIVDEIQDQVTFAVCLNATRKSLLLEQGIDKVDCAIVGIGEDFEANVLVTSLLKGFGVPRVITRSYTDLQKQILSHVGAARVLSPEEEVGGRLAQSLVSGSIVDFLELPEGYVVRQVTAPAELVGKRLGESGVRNRFGIDVIVVKRRPADPGVSGAKSEMIVIPDGEVEIHEGDVLGVVGKERDVEKFA
ncbi:MAG: potassium channel family protein [Candidatus Krumholzibacteriia bacterium]